MSARDIFDPPGSAPHLHEHALWPIYRRIRQHVWLQEWRLRGQPQYSAQDDEAMIDGYLRKHVDDVLGQLKDLFVEDSNFRRGDS